MAHSDKAALRGVPSYVWRDGQERRLKMIEKWAKLQQATVLIDGIGVGMYANQIGERYQAEVHGIDVELERVTEAREGTPSAVVAEAEYLPYASNAFDTVLSHEVLEHVNNDVLAVREIVRVLKVGGRAVIFVPNRWYPFETHGHYWRGNYHFGNTPLINYLPNRLRDKLAPHVKVYTKRGLQGLFDGQPVRFVHHSRVYGGYDNLTARLGTPARVIRDALYRLEQTPFDTWGLSHLLIVEKVG